MSIRVVSLDGGGIKGVLTARILSRLEAESPGWLSRVDLFAGTSTGGILALALAIGLHPDACVRLYSDKGGAIFGSRGVLDTVSGVDEYFRANYGSEGLRAALTGIFGEMKLKDLHHDVLIPAFLFMHGGWRPKFFDREHDADEFIIDVAMATAAAPTYFPAHGWRPGQVYADGGLFANNPSDSAIAFITSKGGAVADIRLLSVGTGVSEIPMPADLEDGATALDWGYRQWIVREPYYLLAALFDGAVLASHFRSREQLNERYVRIQPKLPERIEMDDPSKVDALITIANATDLTEATKWLDDLRPHG